MMPISLDRAYRAAEAALAFNRLLVLDRIWTDYLSACEKIDAEETRVLVLVADQMDHILEIASSHAREIRGFVERSPELADQFMRQLLADERLSERQRSRLKSKVDQAGGIVGLGIQACMKIEEKTADERNRLSNKKETILRGDFTVGDLSKEFACSTAASGLVGGIMLMAANPLAGALVAGASLLYAEYLDC